MQGIEKIAYQNACTVALHRAKEAGTNYFVVRDERGQLDVTDEDPGFGMAVFTARPDGLEVTAG